MTRIIIAVQCSAMTATLVAIALMHAMAVR